MNYEPGGRLEGCHSQVEGGEHGDDGGVHGRVQAASFNR